ncbi:Bug family tripartite tricarboxylate transporter substrate binding protein [Verminephrobacter aporrectodeae]|uniref:Bug family tripartite tricarboxylate transporter substrate binding protein n=1 Tax=Verminephrobacter aporrectodeae TaxID=1110389 RepID=UPI002242FE54|nr:tripartite tricarboxylate transporter substrate binding protein [Verminephrobacter aporrectodeae]MCW8175845.1 tripartite tricarboxylate transporter substrate binding protein [Verminephrobacter aporrectodeae subsp. tuberculatae]MCW8203536.1 tripartite tricarboxylate transporter substrate binding protein [Verminephrobacter aporrectodeae subsp. tuberculatae]
MNTRRWVLSVIVAAAAGLVVLPMRAQAQAADYPGKPVRYIVPFAAGGLTDAIARLVGQKASESLMQPVVIDNKPGANASLGADLAAKSPADGYTWLAITLTHAVNQSLFANLPYSLTKNLTPVVHLANSPLVLVVHADNRANTLQEFLLDARGKSLNGGSSGNGTPPHLGLELLVLSGRISAQHVPYKGGAPSLNDLLGGQLDFIVANLPEAVPYVRAGKLRALAVTSVQRHPLLPDVPTFAQAGLPGMELENWTGLVMPAGTPAAVVDKVAAEVIKALKLPELRNRMLGMGFTPTGLGPTEFGRVIQQDVARWRNIIQERGIRAD